MSAITDNKSPIVDLEEIQEPTLTSWDFKVHAVNMRGALYRLTIKQLLKLLTHAKKQCIAAFLLSEFRLSKEVRSFRLVQRVVQENGFEIYTNPQTMHGAVTTKGASATRSTTAVIINTKWFFNPRDVQYGQFGELTTVVADLRIEDNNHPV